MRQLPRNIFITWSSTAAIAAAAFNIDNAGHRAPRRRPRTCDCNRNYRRHRHGRLDAMTIAKRAKVQWGGAPLPSSSLSCTANNDGESATTGDSSSSVLSQAALIAGTTIGGGFLALPTATAPCGAAPSALGLACVWIYLLGGAFSLSDAIFMTRGRRRLHRRCDDGGDVDEEDDARGSADANAAAKAAGGDVTMSSLMRECFGDAAGALGGLLFLLLIKVTLIAQLSKVGVLLLGGSRRRASTGLFSLAVGALCHASSRRGIERANDALTTAMLLSFASLAALAGGSGWTSDGLVRADYRSLLPPFLAPSSGAGGGGGAGTAAPWAIPVFVQLLVYSEVVPLISSRLGDERKVRRAILLGSSVPLIMCLTWTFVSLGLVPYDPSSIVKGGVVYDPLHSLGAMVRSRGGGCVGKLFLTSVDTLAFSAICTTVIGSILASTQYFDGVIASLTERKGGGGKILSRKHQRLLTHILSVAPSAAIALWGSSNLYYYATSFAGEFPATLLYGLMPPLCNLRLRWRYRSNKGGALGQDGLGGVALQVVLAIASLAILLGSGISK